MSGASEMPRDPRPDGEEGGRGGGAHDTHLRAAGDNDALEHALRIAEALAFASPDPVPARRLASLLDDDHAPDADAVFSTLAARMAGRGVELVAAAGGWQFRTAPDLAPILGRVLERPRRLPRAAMETLAVVAWDGPVTRAEIEEKRGVSLAQATLELLLAEELVRPAGQREVPGRPTLWDITPEFLARFGLRSRADLPSRREILTEPAAAREAGTSDPSVSGGDGAMLDESPDPGAAAP